MTDLANEPEPAPAMRLLRTKLYVPRARADIIQRPWQIAKLSAGMRSPLTLISAPAGFGKTTLLSSWIAQSHVSAVWVSLDERDNDPVRFWAYVLAALQSVDAGIGHTALAMLQAPQPPRMEAIFTELLNDAALLPHDVVLVLDDYHLIEAASIHTAMSFVLDHLPPQLHVFIAARNSPPLALPIRRARRELVEITPNDLRFTTEEAAVFLNQVMGLNLVADDVTALEKLTEGWIAGLQLAALALQSDLADQEPNEKKVSEFVQSFAGRHRFIFDYLAQEVFDRQPDVAQRFLLQTAILERLSGHLCDAVTGQAGSQAMLEQLEAAHLFVVPLDQHHQWYRYHHLLAEFLRSRLDQPARLTIVPAVTLHRRASQWCMEHGLLVEAVTHALQTNDFDYTAQLLISRVASEMFRRSELLTLLDWLDALPQNRIRANPQLSMIYAWILLATSRMNQVNAHLVDVETVLGVKADGLALTQRLPAATRGAVGEILCIRSNLAFHAANLAEAQSLSEQALACLTEDVEKGLFDTRASLRGVANFNIALALEFGGQAQAASEYFRETMALARGEENRHLNQFATSHLAQVQVLQGQLNRAASLYREAIREAEQDEFVPSPVAGMAYAGMGHILREWNQLDAARSHLERGMELGRQWDNVETLLSGIIGLAHIRESQGDWVAAQALWQEAGRLVQQSQTHWGAALVTAHQAECQARHAAAGAPEARAALSDAIVASHWSPDIDLNSAQPIPYIVEAEAIIYARTLIAAGYPEKASRLTGRLLSAADAGGRQSRVIEALTLQAVALLALSQTEQALTLLTRALALAEPEGYVRMFVDEGEPMAALLRQVKTNEARLAEYVSRLLTAFSEASLPPATDRQPSSGTPILSERELQVMQLLIEGRTNQEIAAALFVSLNTVKTHVKSIFTRLDVRNRTEAAARARERGLI